MGVYRIDFYLYREYQDMNAKVPTCEYNDKYGKCNCVECENWISKQKVDRVIEFVCRLGEGGTK